MKKTRNGTPLLRNAVADVRIGNAIRYGAMTYNDESAAAGAVVMMLKGGNSSEVIKNVKDRIKKACVASGIQQTENKEDYKQRKGECILLFKVG